MAFLFNILGSGFLKYLGGATLILVLCIILASLIGGISYNYDTSDRSWGGWEFSINFHFGEAIQNLREFREENGGRFFWRRGKPLEEDLDEDNEENPKFELPNKSRPFLRPLRRLFELRLLRNMPNSEA